jgi:clan AA aspartic protease (TIGR02281 family)
MASNVLFRDKSAGWGGGILATFCSLIVFCVGPLRNEIAQIGPPAPTTPVPPPALSPEPARHIAGAPAREPPRGTISRQIHIAADERSQFWVTVTMNGSISPTCLVDTGASDVVISREMAWQLGLRNLEYTRLSNTANGMTKDASATLDSLEVLGVTARNFPVEVNGGDADICALGTIWSRHFDVQISNGTMTLTPKDL